MPKFACVTDYQKNYSTGYFGHAPGSTSFNGSAIPGLIAEICGAGRGVVDLGGGNGALRDRLATFGIRCLTVDPGASTGEDSITADLSVADQDAVERLRDDIRSRLGQSYLTTCLDVAEHIDIEHVADFIFNLRVIADREIVLSVSTRPSSQGNRYHSCVLPVETWTTILSLCGFEVAPLDSLDATRSTHVFGGGSENLIAISHWQRRNPFRDHVAHQHYLLLRPGPREPMSRSLFSEIVSSLLDTSYRAMKRDQCRGVAFPPLIYSVCFIQDWPFLRSLMDVWPADRLRILLNRESIVPAYFYLLRNLCIRNGVAFDEIDSADDAVGILRSRFAAGALLVTASEGLLSPLHLYNSRIALEARRLGYVTVVLQHGMTMFRNLLFLSEHVAAWDAQSAANLSTLPDAGTRFSARNIGSPKFVDALLPQNAHALEMRLGAWTRRFRKTVLLGTNLHWNVGGRPSEVHAWILSTLASHPDVLFVLRPHPDDHSVFAAAPTADNLIVIDELVLMSMDWSVSRICKAVDGVITTYSTLILDAVAAGKPCAVLPFQIDVSSPASPYLPPSMPPVHQVVDMSLEPGSARAFIGSLDGSVPHRDADDWFASSRSFFSGLSSLEAAAGGASTEALERVFGQAQTVAIAHADPNRSPNADRIDLSRHIEAFLDAPLPVQRTA